MADLKEVRSSNRTAEGGRLFHCTIAKGKNEYFLVICSCLDLNKMYECVVLVILLCR